MDREGALIRARRFAQAAPAVDTSSAHRQQVLRNPVQPWRDPRSSSVDQLHVLEGAEALFTPLKAISTVARAGKRHIGRDALQHVDADAAAREALRDIHLSLL